MKKSKKILLIVLCILLAFIVILTATFFILKSSGKKKLLENNKSIKAQNVEKIDDDTVEYNGQKYRLDPDVVSVLVMGVDKNDITKKNNKGTSGQADCIFVLAIDTVDKTYKIIPISRETMVDIRTYSSSGAYLGTENKQLCLAYAYGKTPEKSSENVLDAVSRSLYGVNIKKYITVDMNGIEKYSKIIGGIDVTALEDIKLSNKTYSKGQNINLQGENAITYIRNRDKDLDANNRRMERQKQFFNSMLNKTSNLISDDFSRVTTYYNTMKPYTSTNFDLSEITFLASTSLSRNIGSKLDYKKIEGTMKLGEFAEFYPDENSVLSAVFDAFYQKIS